MNHPVNAFSFLIQRCTSRLPGAFVLALGGVFQFSSLGAQAAAADPTTEKGADSSAAAKDDVVQVGAFEVLDSKVLNMDLKRSADDPQPYVILDRAKIQGSGVPNLEQFFRQRLSMNTQAQINSTNQNFSGNSSSVNLYGLGTNNTLILIDGHRLADFNFRGSPVQPNINSIPLGALERVEVLPTTASGIYGGSATGGVINLVLRRDYNGAEIKTTYGSTFESNVSNKRFDLSTGFTLEDGKTSVLLAASYFDQTPLLNGQRPFYARGVARIMANNPSVILNSTSFVGNTPNIISANGANLVLKDGTPLNSKITYVPYGYAGIAGDGGAALVANAGRFNLVSPNSGQSGGTKIGIFAGSRAESFYGSIRRQFSPNFQMFVDLQGENDSSRWPTSGPGGGTSTLSLPATAATNPFQQAITVVVPNRYDDALRTRDFGRRAIAGAIVKLPYDWAGELDFSYGRNRSSYLGPSPGSIQPAGTAAIAAGQVPLIQDTNLYPVSLPGLSPTTSNYTEAPFLTNLYDTTLRLTGPLGFLHLPGGAPHLAGLVEYREEDIGSGKQYFFGGPFSYYPGGSQSVQSAYLEATLPVIGKKNNIPAIQSLDLQFAGRADKYNNKGKTSTIAAGSTAPVYTSDATVSSTNPTVALKYQPISDIALRASYGKGFLPPTPAQTAASPNTSSSIISVIDPRRGNETVVLNPGSVITGGDPSIQPEKSVSSSAGIVITPRFVHGLRLSLDYIKIKKTNNIVSSPTAQFLVDNEALFPTRVIRGLVLTGSTAGAIVGLNQSAINVAESSIEAYNGEIGYEVRTEFGAVDLHANATWQPKYTTKANATAEVQNAGVGTSASIPLKRKYNLGLTWEKNSWNAGWNMRYYSDYLVAIPGLASSAAAFTTQGYGGKVPSQSYHDFFVRYAWTKANVEIQLGLKNAFNKQPPTDAVLSGGFYASLIGDTLGRSYLISVTKRF